jgi:hypothetical protein
MSVILTTWEAEIRRIKDWGQLDFLRPFLKNTQHRKRPGRVVQVGRGPALQVKPWVQTPVPQKHIYSQNSKSPFLEQIRTYDQNKCEEIGWLDVDEVHWQCTTIITSIIRVMKTWGKQWQQQHVVKKFKSCMRILTEKQNSWTRVSGSRL